MKVFIDTRDGDLLIMKSSNCYKWIPKKGKTTGWKENNAAYDLLWYGFWSWDDTFIRISIKRYYDKIEST
jgi:hypothetical protein